MAQHRSPQRQRRGRFGKASEAATLPSREAAERAAREVEALIVSRCGYAVALHIVPVAGGVPVTRRSQPTRTA